MLATIHQVFSLLDPLIFRYVIDEYATRFKEYTTSEFFRGVGLLLAAAVGVAFVSRVAKNFQDYVINVVTQRLGAQLYADGIRHSLDLPYQTFEDQRSGETLGSFAADASVASLKSASTTLLPGADGARSPGRIPPTPMTTTASVFIASPHYTSGISLPYVSSARQASSVRSRRLDSGWCRSSTDLLVNG